MLPPEVQRDAALAHVGVAVRDLAEAETADGATVVSVPAGGAAVELLTSADPSSPVGKYLARHGPGIHHLCFRVPDLEAALARCRAAGYRLIDDVPRRGADGRRVAFLHPRATAGILLELSD